MFRPTPFTPSDIARSIVAREKATKVRYFDPETARMSGWMPKGERPAPALHAAAQLTATITFSGDPKPITSQFETALYGSMPVAQLRKFASESGVKNASRMRKGDIIAALTEPQPATA